jgi:hypothetical protein
LTSPERTMQRWWSPIGDLVLCSQTKKYTASDYGNPPPRKALQFN